MAVIGLAPEAKSSNNAGHQEAQCANGGLPRTWHISAEHDCREYVEENDTQKETSPNCPVALPLFTALEHYFSYRVLGTLYQIGSNVVH